MQSAHSSMKRSKRTIASNDFISELPIDKRICGPPITTNLDDKNCYKHEIKHEKTIEAVITEYPENASNFNGTNKNDNAFRDVQNFHNQNTAHNLVPSSLSNERQLVQEITRKNRVSTEVLGSTLESTKMSQRGTNGHRRITTQIVRKVTTLSHAEQQPYKKYNFDSTFKPVNFMSKSNEKSKISDIVVGKEDNVSAREALLRWARRSTARYPGVRVNDFTSSWRDGLAFSALVHRNRPDLLDWRKARSDRPLERLENAFHVVEKEYGVTRLLDPEDVDTNEPDEKSIITYISSLYDVFPEPPSIHPLFDMESQRRVHEYSDLARQFIHWCKEKTAYLQERSYPPTLIELKRLLSEVLRFKNEEFNIRIREKSKLIQIYKELERYFESIGEIDVDLELRPDTIDKAWYYMQKALLDREQSLQKEIERLERLQRIADKIQRECKHIDIKITEIETAISEDIRQIDRLHPVDAKAFVESLETEISQLEEPLKGMTRDCETLLDGSYPYANELQKNVLKLHQRWIQLQSIFHANLVQKLTNLKYPIHETTVTRQTRKVVESRQIDTNPLFQELQEHIEWCQNKLKQIVGADYGSDLQSVKEEFDKQQQEHKIIDQFHSKVKNDENQKSRFSGDELILYQQRLSQLQKVYAELLTTSTRRLSDLDSLQYFLVQASAELQWLNEKEQIEINRNWADKNLDLLSVHRYYEELMSELEKREVHFAAILDRGEALLNQQHPASKCVEAHLSVLQQQWAWLLQLTLCLEVHLKHATERQQFFVEIKNAEEWLNKREEVLTSKYSRSDFGLDEGESLLRGMQDLREELNRFGETIVKLQQQSQTIVPLNKRHRPVNRQCIVQAICAYKQQGHVNIEKGETCTLLDNSGRVKWRVRNTRGKEGSVPGACLLLPPPDEEAIDAAKKLKNIFDRTISLWQKKHLRLRQNMIFATIRVVKSWDFDQFLAMGPEQRTAIRRALNEDAEKLLNEGDPNDPQLRRLRREMDEVNRLFDEFEKRARAEEESKQASRVFMEECISIKGKLEDLARELDQIILSPLPRDMDSFEHVMEILVDFNRRLKLFEPQLIHLQESFRSIALKTPTLKKSLDNILELWKELNTQSNLHQDRLTLLEVSLNGIDENEHFISEIENDLTKHQNLPSDADGLQFVFSQLTNMHDSITQQQPHMDKMNNAADQLGRMGVPTKVLSDLKRLHTNIERLNARWNEICNQLADRMRSCETAIGMMKNIQSSVQVEESWIDGTTEKLSSIPTATSAFELDKLLGVTIEHKPKIENLNLTGGRIIREAKIYDSKCLRFIDWLLEVRPSFSPPRFCIQLTNTDLGAAEVFSQRIQTLNRKYENLLDILSQRLKTAIEVNGRDGLQYAESLQKPLKIFKSDIVHDAPNFEKKPENNGDLYTTTFSTTEFCSTNTTTKTNYTTTFKSIDNANYDSSKSNILAIPGILNPLTGDKLTIQNRLVDVHTGEMLVDDKKISLQEAIKSGFINEQLATKLLQTNLNDNKNETNLLGDLIQHGPENVKYDNKSQTKISISEKKTTLVPISFNDAITAGSVDPHTGLFQIKSGDQISLEEAYKRGYLIRHESVTIKSNALCLSDAIAHGLVDSSGWITDRNSGDKFRLDSAIANQLIDPNIREVVYAKNDSKLTLNEALNLNILNPKTGRYLNELTREKLTYTEAKNRQLIVKPYTLKDVCDLNLLDKSGQITSPMRRDKFNIIRAIKFGVLDDHNLKCITKRKGELVTLQEAIADGIILPIESIYKDFTTNELMSIPEAVERGLISSVSQKSIFDIDGFKDLRSNDFISFNVALSRDILRRKTNDFVIETKKNEYEPLEVALRKGLVREEVLEMFNKEIGVKDKFGNDLSLLGLCCNKLIDTKSGFLLEPKTGKTIPLDIAIERKVITPEGALLLSSLLNITLTTETVTRTINRYVTIQPQIADIKCEKGLTFSEAVKSGYIDEDKHLFIEPQSKNVYSVQQALTYGLLKPNSNEDNLNMDHNKKTKSTISIVTKQISPKTETTQKIINKPVDAPIPQNMQVLDKCNYNLLNSTSELNPLNDATIKERNITNVPTDGWHLKEAIELGIFDAVTGQLNFVESNKQICFKECIQKHIINSKSCSVIDPRSKEKISVDIAFLRNVIDSSGKYTNENNDISTMDQAIKQKKIVLENPNTTKIIEKCHNLPIKEISSKSETERSIPLSDFTSKLEEVKSLQYEKSSPEPLQIGSNAIYDPSTSLVIFTKDGKTENIFNAVRQGLVDEGLVTIKDPLSDKQISISEAIERKIYDPKNETILKDGSESVDLLTASKVGLVTVIGAPLVAIEGALRTMRFITDPSNGDKIPVELAYERGIVSSEELPIRVSFKDDITERENFMSFEKLVRFDNLNLPKEDVVETDGAVHTIKTKTIDLVEGYILISNNEVKNLSTGESLSFNDAKKMGILFENFTETPLNIIDSPCESSKTNNELQNSIATNHEHSMSNVVRENKLVSQNIMQVSPEEKTNNSTDVNLHDEFCSLRYSTVNEDDKLHEQEERNFSKCSFRPQLQFNSNDQVSLKNFIDSGLYDINMKCFIDPSTKEKISFQNLIYEMQILDPDLILVKDLNNAEYKPLDVALEQHLLDKYLGHMVDPKSGVKVHFFDCVKRNWIVLNKHYINNNKDQNNSPEVCYNSIGENAFGDLSLKEAIDFKIINPKTAYVRDRTTQNFIPLEIALQSNNINLNLRTFIDSKASFFAFTPTFVVYVRKPIEFDEAVEKKILNLQTGSLMHYLTDESNTKSPRIYTLKDGVTMGIIDPDSALVKDEVKNKLIRLPEAFRKGLMDANKANVLNSKTHKIYPLKKAYEIGLLVTPKHSFGLLEALRFDLYSPEDGLFTDPFQNDFENGDKKLMLNEAIENRLISVSETVVRDSLSGEIIPLSHAIKTELINANTGRLRDNVEQNEIDLLKAVKKGLIFAAEERQAVFEKFNVTEQNINELLKWVTNVEQKISNLGRVKENIDEMHSQINSAKQIKDEIDNQQRPIAACLEQIRQIVLTGSDVLSAPEVTTLESSGRELRSRVDRANDRIMRLIKCLESSRNELDKVRNELNVFSTWLQSARRILEDKERSLTDLSRLSNQTNSIREFMNDVIGHQADLRFITMTAQKFVDESKEYLATLNDLRTTLPVRLPYIEPISGSESPIRKEISLVSAQYKDLMNRVTNLQDRVTGINSRQRDHQEALNKANDWLNNVQPRFNKIFSEPIGGDSKSIQDQMEDAKSVYNEVLSNGRLMDNAQQTLDGLLSFLNNQLSPREVEQLELPVIELKSKYQKLLDSLADQCRKLDKTLVESQGVQSALDNLANWANQVDDKFKLQIKPASLIKERLQEQIREHKALCADVYSHQASIDSIQSSANHLVNTASNARVAKSVELGLNDVTNKFDKLVEKMNKRGEFLENVYGRLNKHLNDIHEVEQGIANLMNCLEHQSNSLHNQEIKIWMSELSNQKNCIEPLYEEALRGGKELINMRDVTDTSHIRDRIKALELQWKNINITIDEKTKQIQQKEAQKHTYDELRDLVLSWLANTEARVNSLSPISLDMEKIRQQNEELRPINNDYKEFAATIDKICDIGMQYDANVQPESPSRKRSTYSPIKRVGPSRRMSEDVRSPSPTKGGTLSPLSPTSSGFGSRRSSHDGFHISELSPVQQQISEINNRYNLIGVRLTDRQTEIDFISDELRKLNENYKNLYSFLDRMQRLVSKDSVLNKEDADRSIKQARKALEDMYEKQNLLDSTKVQTKDLLRRKPDVLGSQFICNETDKIVEKWKNFNDIFKNKIEFAEKLRDFLDTHSNLKNWLESKERMLTVLGPISSDPRMVQSQVQQVQVLKEEFRAQEPQLKHFQVIAKEILEQLKHSSDASQINDKQHYILTKWDDLIKRLDDRSNNLGGAVDSSKEFDAAVSRLREALQSISDKLDMIPLNGNQEDSLRKIENLERQLEGQRPLLTDAEQSAAALCNILGDPASRADINSRVSSLEKQYQALQKKLDTKKAETEGLLKDERNYAESCSKILGWLMSELSSLSERLLISAHKPILQHQIDSHEPIYREVMTREHEVIMLLNKGNEMSERLKDRAVKRDLERIQQQWEKLRREAVDRQSRLQTCMEHCKKYSHTSERFLSWLRTAEDKLHDLKPGILSKNKLENLLKDLQSFRSEVWKHSGEFENTKSLGETFLNSCDVDKEPIKAELKDIRDRWERLNNDLTLRGQEIDNSSRRLGNFNDELKNLDHAVGRCEDRLATHDALGGAAKDPKLLDRVKAIREELTSLSKPLQTLKSMVSDISSEARATGGDADYLINDVNNIADRIHDLQNRLDDRCGELMSAATAVSQFNEKIKKLATDINNFENEVEQISQPEREIKIVTSQLENINKFQKELLKLNDRLEDVEHTNEALLDSGFASDNLQTRDQITTMRKTLTRLDNCLHDHNDNLRKTLDLLHQFYEMHSQILKNIRDVSEEFAVMKPVSSELDQIRKQQNDFNKFRAHKIEPLSQNVDKVNLIGRDLVRSANTGISTATIEKDLEKLNENWNNLKERMNERDRRLDVALLQSGKFQEALAGLSKWLSDTEEMVSNQKPPSSDYKVVKAQLQEQKFLKKMLLDRQNSMSSLLTLGKEVANHCDASEQNSIEKQLNNLMKRFDALTTGAEQRELDLEAAMDIAKHFHDKFASLEIWLDNTERSVKAMELIPTDEEKIQQRIREHDRLHNELLSKKSDFTDLANIAEKLMHIVDDDEAVSLGEKVKTMTDRYTNLVDLSDSIGGLLDESRQGLRHLVLTYQELVAWMDEMENDLKRFKYVPVNSEKLLEQMDQLLELNENIANHAPNVESTVESGSELIKHISNDEALQLKDKLDSLQRRYGDLTNRGGDLLKNAQNALPLVQQFHEAHNRLLEWIQIAETALASSEPNQSDVLKLETEVIEMRPVLDMINLVGPQLCQISPGEGASVIENIVTRDNRRFDAIVEQIQRKAERLHLSNQRAKEVTNDIDELLEWFREMDVSLREAELPAIEPKIVRTQLQEHRSVNDDISSQKGRVRDVMNVSKKVLREFPQNDNTTMLREKLEDLKEIVDIVIQLCSERLSVLEQALPLSEHFADSHNGVTVWLDDMEQQISRLSLPSLRPDQITLQQDKNERFLQSIAEHKPLLDKLNKTGEALGALVSEDDNAKINELLDSDNSRYAALRLELRERQQTLENALQESSKFSDKLEGMLRALANTVDQVNQLDPLSALPQKIREQIDDNAAIVNDLNNRSDAFSAVQQAANDVIAKAANKSDPAVRDIKSKLEKLNNLWNDVQKATKTRGSSLDEILNVAEPFWKQLNSVMKTLRDLEETLSSQEPPATQPQDIQKQQVALQEIRHEIDQTKPDVELVKRHGSNLMNMCGEPDKPEVKKHIEDLDNAWDNITALYAKREENLIDAMEKAMEFHETLQNLLKFLSKAEDKFAHLGAVGSDIDAVKKQIEQLRAFKDEVDPHMVEVEALNRQATELTERTSPEQAASIRDPLSVVNRRWETLLRGMVERQKQLEHALLHLGQFQHALNELLIWIEKTDKTLDQLKPIPGDPQLLEVELAKLKVLANDIQAHQNSVDTLNDAGRQLIESEKGSMEASTTQDKLHKLNDEWKTLLQKASDRQHELEEALREAQYFISEVQDILGWLGDVDAVIGASKPVGGLPETATEQLERFMEVYNELEENRPKVETIQAQGQEYIKKQTQIRVPSSNLQHTLRTLKQRWDVVVSRASDKKIKLEIALKEATEFHDTLQAFVEWLTIAEKQLANASPVSRVLEKIQIQIDEHKILQKDVSTHREGMLLLDKKGTHLKYFSQKQDVILIKNVLVSVQHRWERVVSKSAERTRALDHGYKEAREFNDSWQSLMQYLEETESILNKTNEEALSTKEPQKIKKYLTKLKEVHRQLTGKQSSYDITMRGGKNLVERAPKDDENILNKMLSDLKESWTRVWSKSIERQRKLEEALLLSGQFSDALLELLDWLRKAKNRLNENGPVHGDLETVEGLIEHHKHIEVDLHKRANQMQGVLKIGRELEKSGNNLEVGVQLDDLQKNWNETKNALDKRGDRLQNALKDAEKLNGNIQKLFDWLDHAEQKLRYAKNAPDDEKISREMRDIHIDFLNDIKQRECQKNETFVFAEEIISKAYPDAIPIIKNWMSIIQQRWDDIYQWAINRESKLEQHLQALKDLDNTIEELLSWLTGLEATLLSLEREKLPDDIEFIEKLIEDHKDFMENTARRQVEIDRACKPKQLSGARKISRNIKTPVRGSNHDLREQSPDGSLRRQSFKGSRDQGLNTRKSSRVTPSRDTPDRDRLPHYGPRFSPSSLPPETEFRSPRAKLLWDKWRHVWMLSWERQRRLHEHLIYLRDVERVRNFSWDDWRKRFLKYMNHKKSRLTDLFRKMDKDNNGLIPRGEFIDGILNTKFDTSRLEMGAVADLFDRNGEGLIDWQEFIAALRPDWQERKPANDSDKIHDEVKRLVMLCTCRQKFRVFQVGEGKYRFGDSQKLRLVRILRSTVMVRVGGGWVALDEFLQKNDPCRAEEHLAELMPIFERIRAQEQVPCAFPIHMGTGGTVFVRCNNSRSLPLSPHVLHCHPTTHWVRERSVRSIPMSRPSRSSLSASTPDSLSDNEANPGAISGRYTPRKVTYTSVRSGQTPVGSRSGSKPNSRPLSRQGSKPTSQHGSTISLDSTDELTPSRIPQRRFTSNVSSTNATLSRPSRISIAPITTIRTTDNVNIVTRKTASGSASPAPNRSKQNIGGLNRSSSIPALTGFGFKYRRNVNSGGATPSGVQTPRKSSADPTFSSTMRKTSRGTTPVEKREPFRL